MNVIYEEADLEHKLSAAASVSPEHPVVITKFIDNAQEIDVDAVAHEGKLLLHAVSEHVENAGVHSGDATLVLPPFSLYDDDMARLKEIAEKVAKAFHISGPFNMQIIRKPSEEGYEGEPELKVIECNLRASRSFPFVSKVLGTNFVETAAAAIVGHDVPEPVDLMAQKRDYTAIKVSQFSWTRLPGADPFLGVEMASTGEVASFGKDIHEAYWASLLSTNGFKIPKAGSGVLIGGDITKPEMATIAKGLVGLGFKLHCASNKVEEFLNDLPYIKAKKIFFPTRDKRKLREVFDDYDIQLVFNLAKSRATDAIDEDYVARRNAVDFGIPLLNNARCAQLFVEALAQKLPEGGLKPYREGRIPTEAARSNRTEVTSKEDTVLARACQPHYTSSIFSRLPACTYTVKLPRSRLSKYIARTTTEPMSRAEIAAWVSNAQDFDEDDYEESNQPQTTNDATDEENWEAFVKLATKKILSSKTKERIGFLNDKVLVIAHRGDQSQSQINDILGIIASTYARYIDGPSREAVIAVLEAFVQRDESKTDEPKYGIAEYLLGWLKGEIPRATHVSPGDQFVLLTWCAKLYDILLDCNPALPDAPSWPILLSLFSTIFDSILDDSSQAKPTVRQSSFVHSRRAIRNRPNAIPKALTTSLKLAETSSTPTRFAPFIGLIIDVAIRIKPSKNVSIDVQESLHEFKASPSSIYYEGECSTISAFDDFFRNLVSEDDFSSSLLSGIEQALGRGTPAAAEGNYK
ncbi:carbamoyl-phosphate synthase (glutamine-hydrolyzing) cpa2, partial [Tulasnella sp. 427]